MAARLGAGGEGSGKTCLQDEIAMGVGGARWLSDVHACGRDLLRVRGNYSECEAWKRKRAALVA